MHNKFMPMDGEIDGSGGFSALDACAAQSAGRAPISPGCLANLEDQRIDRMGDLQQTNVWLQLERSTRIECGNVLRREALVFCCVERFDLRPLELCHVEHRHGVRLRISEDALQATRQDSNRGRAW